MALIRRPTLLECIGAVQTLEADAFVGTDLEGRYVLSRLGLSDQFQMAERSFGVRSIHLIAARSNPDGPALIETVNSGLRQLKKTDAYAAIIQRHVLRLLASKSVDSP